VIQESWVPHEDAVYDRVGNILLTRLMGADSRIVFYDDEIVRISVAELI
jgi:1-aminocyclopropane-1-carboxylate deaminase/D-cysteine desulfhydrase-like pyridoxal-dependent ACC family enzyme